MANCYGSLDAVDCHIHSVRYDMAVGRAASSGHLDVVATRRRYDQQMLEPWKRCFYNSLYLHQPCYSVVGDLMRPNSGLP
eukprot:scaffold40440_cov168-Skeletonema_marinoi.AAC.1